MMMGSNESKGGSRQYGVGTVTYTWVLEQYVFAQWGGDWRFCQQQHLRIYSWPTKALPRYCTPPSNLNQTSNYFLNNMRLHRWDLDTCSLGNGHRDSDLDMPEYIHSWSFVFSCPDKLIVLPFVVFHYMPSHHPLFHHLSSSSL